MPRACLHCALRMWTSWRGSGSLRAAQRVPMTADADGARMSRGFSQVCMARCSNKVVYSFCGSLFILVLCLSGEMEGYLEWWQKRETERHRKVRPSEFLGETQEGTQRERGVDNQPEEEQLDWDKNWSRETGTSNQKGGEGQTGPVICPGVGNSRKSDSPVLVRPFKGEQRSVARQYCLFLIWNYILVTERKKKVKENLE